MEVSIISASSVTAGAASVVSGGSDVGTTGASGVDLAHAASNTPIKSKNHFRFIKNISFRTSIGFGQYFQIVRRGGIGDGIGQSVIAGQNYQLPLFCID
jgi:hypothetical protein